MTSDAGTRANVVGLGVNVVLALGKLTAGVLAGSQALVADGFNSAGDVVATSIATVGYVVGQRPPDDNHHYGHGNAETMAGLVVGGMLLATGLYIALDGVLALIGGRYEAPGLLAAWVAGGTAVTKEVLYRYTHRVGTRLHAPSLLATARDHRADVASALAVLVGVLAARASAPWLDPLAAVGIGLYITYMAVEPIRSNLGVLMAEAPPGMADAVRFAARGHPDVREVDGIRVHPLGSYYVVSLEIFLDGEMNLFESHDVAHAVAAAVRERLEHVADVQVHVNPTGSPAVRARRG